MRHLAHRTLPHGANACRRAGDAPCAALRPRAIMPQCTRFPAEALKAIRTGRTSTKNTMSDTHLLQVLRPQLEDLKAKGLYKRERQIQGPQGAAIRVGGREVVNFCANNYLGSGEPPRRRRGGARGAAALRLRRRLGALHLRHAGPPQGARSGRSPAS